jgi:hypothetical protein
LRAIEELRRLGFEIEAAGDRVRVRHQSKPQAEALPLLEYIRQHKADVLAALMGPQPVNNACPIAAINVDGDVLDGFVAEAPPRPPRLPHGLRLVSYSPKRPPVALEQCSIVTNVQLFIQSSLADLEDRLNRPKVNRYGWTVPQILDRLRQVGLVIEIDTHDC